METTGSIYQRVLGADFQRLHPQIQRRFGISSRDRRYAISTGVMDEVWRGPLYTLPFLALGAWRRIMFPESGFNVPFTLENYAYVDSLGRETVTWHRSFTYKRSHSRADAYMIYSEQRNTVVDYLGTHQNLAADLDISVTQDGGIRLRSGLQRFYEGPIAFAFPLMFSGTADVCEWYDDASQCFRIEVDIRNLTWGRLSGYRGSFQVEWFDLPPEGVPAHVLPRRTERRE